MPIPNNCLSEFATHGVFGKMLAYVFVVGKNWLGGASVGVSFLE